MPAPQPCPQPLAPAPQPWASATLLPVPRQDYLPAPRGAMVRRRGDAAVLKPPFLRRISEQADLAWDSDALRPRPVLRPSRPPARVAPKSVLDPWASTGPDGARATADNDPTLDQSRRAALAGVPRLRHKTAPFLRVTIPDPFALAETIRLGVPPDDDDPPAPPPDVPPAPKLPLSSKR